MSEEQLGYRAFFDGVPLLNHMSDEWKEGWNNASHDLSISQESHFDTEVTEFGYGDIR